MNIISHKQVHPMRWKRRPLKAKAKFVIRNERSLYPRDVFKALQAIKPKK